MSKCIGCGVELQDIDSLLDGYVKDINHQLCERCFIIKNYGQNKVVNKSNIDYMKILDKITDDDLVVYVSSLLTLNLDYIDKFKNVILVMTKRDIIPKSVKNGKIIKYLNDRYDNILDMEIVSSYKKYNLDDLYNKLIKYGKNKKIYFVGMTNSGKSTLINEMIKSYNGCNGEITMSNYPSTTLDVLPVQIGDLDIYDTPGIVCNNSIINFLDNKHIQKINSKKEIKPITFQIKGKGAILIDELIRIEYETDISSMTFYVSNNLSVDGISLKNYRLNDCKYLSYDISSDKDIVIEDIGFIKCTNSLKIKIYYKDDVSIIIRDNLI